MKVQLWDVDTQISTNVSHKVRRKAQALVVVEKASDRGLVQNLMPWLPPKS
jgi:hypothetical protein